MSSVINKILYTTKLLDLKDEISSLDYEMSYKELHVLLVRILEELARVENLINRTANMHRSSN